MICHNSKIAAIHDERQSLPITLQFIGRFTRTASNLGDASFVTNIAYAPISQELNQLYQQDADWNFLLPTRVRDKEHHKKLNRQLENVADSFGNITDI